MSIVKILFQLFIIYMLYKLVFDFIIPVYRSSIRMKQKMNEMNDRMKQQEKKEAAPAKKSINSDYIDYEEIK